MARPPETARPGQSGNSAGRGVFVAVVGIDAAGTSGAVQTAGWLLRRRGVPAIAFGNRQPPFVSAWLDRHLTALHELAWSDQPDDPHLAEPDDDHWMYLRLAWYTAVARCVVEPLLAGGHVVLVDAWTSMFSAALSLRPQADADHARALLARLIQPDAVIHLRRPASGAAERAARPTPTGSGNAHEPVAPTTTGSVASQTRLAAELASLAHERGWLILDTANLTADQVAEAVASLVGTVR